MGQHPININNTSTHDAPYKPPMPTCWDDERQSSEWLQIRLVNGKMDQPTTYLAPYLPDHVTTRRLRVTSVGDACQLGKRGLIPSCPGIQHPPCPRHLQKISIPDLHWQRLCSSPNPCLLIPGEWGVVKAPLLCGLLSLKNKAWKRMN